MRRDMVRSVAALCAILAGTAAQAEIDYEVETGVGHSSNITRTSDAEVSETLASLGLNGTWRTQSPRVQADVLADVSYVEYLDDTYDGEIIGTADANFIFGIVPETFTWQVQDSFGQARANPFEPVTPQNRENVNYFTTGPDFRVRLGDQMALQLYGRYSATNYERSQLDGDRKSVGFGLFRALSAASRIGINGVADKSEFDAPTTPSYERRSAYFSYDLTAGRTQVSAQVGHSWLQVDGQDSDGGALVNLRVTREISSASSIVLSASQQFTDAAEALRAISGGGGSLDTGGGAVAGGSGGGGGVTASSAPYEGRDVSASWQFAKRRTTASLGATYNQSTYQTQTLLDRDRYAYYGNFSRQLRPMLSLILTGQYSQEKFDTAGFESDDWMGMLQLSWRTSRHFGWRLSAEYYDRSTSNGIGEYVETRGMLYFTYTGGDSDGVSR